MSQFKNQKEVLEALFAGKKIRRTYDHEDEYIFMNDNGNVCDEDGAETTRIVYYREAEIYTPPITLGEKILEIMKDHTRSSEKALCDIRYIIESGNYKE